MSWLHGPLERRLPEEQHSVYPYPQLRILWQLFSSTGYNIILGYLRCTGGEQQNGTGAVVLLKTVGPFIPDLEICGRPFNYVSTIM